MAKINFSAPPVFGFESTNVNADRTRNFGSRGIYRFASSLFKVMGYCPLIGTAVGIGRLADTVISKKYSVSKPTSYLAGRLTRGAIEALSLGIVFLPLDIIVTIKRCLAKPKNEALENAKEDYVWDSDSDSDPYIPPYTSPSASKARANYSFQTKALELLKEAEVVEQKATLAQMQQECRAKNRKCNIIDIFVELYKEESLKKVNQLYLVGEVVDGRRIKDVSYSKSVMLDTGAVTFHLEYHTDVEVFYRSVIQEAFSYIESYKTAKAANREAEFLKAYNDGDCFEAKLIASYKWINDNFGDRFSLDELVGKEYKKGTSSRKAVIDNILNKHQYSWEKTGKKELTREIIKACCDNIGLWDDGSDSDSDIY